MQLPTFSEWFVDGVDLLEMAKMIIENNYFEFNEEIYWQRQGIQLLEQSLPRLLRIYLCMSSKQKRDFWMIFFSFGCIVVSKD
jgi:hypothetical protein